MSEALEVKDKSKKYEIDMTNGPILKKMLRFAIPVMFSGLLQLLFNAADIIVVGRFAGDEALAAVGASSSPVNLIVTLLIGLSTGVNVTVAKAYGAGREKDISESVHTAILLAIIGGILMAITGLLSCQWLLKVTGTPEEIVPLSSQYMNILFIGIPIMALYKLAAGILNVCLNLIFVIVFHLAVVGVALATVLSQIVSMSLIIGTLMKDKGAFRLELRKLRLYRSKVKPILVIGVPAGIQGMLFSISNMAIQSSINSFGKIYMAGSSASASLEGFTFVGMDAFTQSAVSFTSQNIGAGKVERVPLVFRTAITLVTAAGLILGLLTYSFGRPLLSIYTNNPAVIDAGLIRMLFLCVPYFLCGIQNVIPGTTRGMGYSIVPTFITVIGVCALRIVWIATVCQLPGCSTIHWVYASYPFSWTVTAISHYIYYKIAYSKTLKEFRKDAAIA